MTGITVVNTTCMFKLDTRVDLDILRVIFKNSRAPKNKKQSNSKFNSVIIKRKNCTAMMFSSGSVILTGGKSITSVRKTARDIVKRLCSKGFPNTMLDFRVTNLVGSFQLSSGLDIKSFIQTVGGSYEPELFPGLIYKLLPRGSITVFINGKVFITGFVTVHKLRTNALEFILLAATFLN